MSRKSERRSIKATEIRVGTGADGSKTLTGYAVVFNTPSVDLGGFTEICSPGMFTRTLKESPDVIMLRDHISSQLLGRTTAGTLSLNQDSKGLAFTVTLPNTAIAEDTFENVRAGNLNSCSFGFSTREDKWTSTPDGAVLRTLLDVDLAEVSITSFAAYPATSVSLRSCPESVRGLLKRSDDETDEDTDDCECPCDACVDGDCDDCSHDPCDCDGCDCPQHDERSKRPDDWKRYMRLQLAFRSK